MILITPHIANAKIEIIDEGIYDAKIVAHIQDGSEWFTSERIKTKISIKPSLKDPSKRIVTFPETTEFLIRGL